MNELIYLNNLESQFRVIESALLKGRKSGLKTINLKEYVQKQKREDRPGMGTDKVSQ